MITKCPTCEGRLREKHYETVMEQGKQVKIVHLRCTACGKYVQHRIMESS